MKNIFRILILFGLTLFSACATGQSISGDEIENTLRQHQEDLRACYLVMAPALVPGRVLIHFNIQPDGSVGDADVKSSTFQSPQIGVCIVVALKKMKFPKPRQNGIEEVIYPFNFTVPKSS